MKKANNGGTLYVPKGQTIIIGKKLDLSFLYDVHLELEGEIRFTDDIKYWQSKSVYTANLLSCIEAK